MCKVEIRWEGLLMWGVMSKFLRKWVIRFVFNNRLMVFGVKLIFLS